MRTMLLSLKPEVFENVCMGKKIFEHRRVFPDDEVKAYIYISRPVQALAGIMYLGNKVSLCDWRVQYADDKEAVKRIDAYMEHHKVAMEIKKFQNTSRILLNEIKDCFPDFLIPQMYYYLDGLPLLDYLEKNLTPIDMPVIHTFDNITSDMICIH